MWAMAARSDLLSTALLCTFAIVNYERGDSPVNGVEIGVYTARLCLSVRENAWGVSILA